jgi:hypothetical protein
LVGHAWANACDVAMKNASTAQNNSNRFITSPFKR